MNLKSSLFVLLLISTSALSNTEAQTTVFPESRFQLGAGVQAVLPNRYPALSTSLAMPNLNIGIPLLGNTFAIEASYGNVDDVVALMLEGNYRLTVRTPFFRGYALLGFHYFNYSIAAVGHPFVGGTTGIGFIFATGASLEMILQMKLFIEDRTYASFGGGFQFLL